MKKNRDSPKIIGESLNSLRALNFDFIYEELKEKYCLDNGRMAEDTRMLFKYLLLKVIDNLSDVDVVAHSRYDMPYKWFLRLAPESDVIDPSTLCKFSRQWLSKDGLLDKLIVKSVKIAVGNGLKLVNSPRIAGGLDGEALLAAPENNRISLKICYIYGDDKPLKSINMETKDNNEKQEKTWICSVCGYKHVGTEPPKKCPVCGVEGIYFDPVE